jgi:competence protein ComEC
MKISQAKLGLLAFCLLALNVALAFNLLRVPRGFEVHMLDIGQGDAILLVTPDQHHILIDGGPGRSVLLELSEVMPGLWKEIDLLVLSHPHLDHMEGLISVLDRFEVKAVLASLPDYSSQVYGAFLEAVEESGAELYLADDGTDFCFETSGGIAQTVGANCMGLFLDVLYPFEPFTGEEMENINNASPVILAEWRGDVRILLTGDAEFEVEEELLEYYCLDAPGRKLEVVEDSCPVLQADIHKAGHHGSRTSSTLEFLKAVGAEILLISAGVDNSYGHPHAETLEKAASLGMEVRRTDLEGRVSLGF